jgi:hypothetical protein
MKQLTVSIYSYVSRDYYSGLIEILLDTYPNESLIFIIIIYHQILWNEVGLVWNERGLKITIGETLSGITKLNTGDELNIYVVNLVIPPSLSPIVIVIMYHLVPTLELFEMKEGSQMVLELYIFTR